MREGLGWDKGRLASLGPAAWSARQDRSYRSWVEGVAGTPIWLFSRDVLRSSEIETLIREASSSEKFYCGGSLTS